MKPRLILFLAVCLIALGAVGDHLLSIGLNHPAAAVAQTTPATGNVITTAAISENANSGADVSASAIDQATEHAFSVASPSVVYVDNLSTGTGSGIIYDSQGDIVTNDHVVDGTTTLRVTLQDARSFSASVVGTDPVDDLAVLRIHASGLTPAHFAPAGSFQVAQMVLVIGSPLGLKQSVTSGLISGLDRVEQEPNGAYLPNAIQTSAPINPGNSGGAMITLEGVVVGMPTLEQTSAQDGTAAQNIGFAVPSTRITTVANQIIATGKVEHTGRAYLGISPADPSSQQSSPFGGGFGQGGFGFGQGGNSQPVTGAVVQQVASNGPAAQAGIQQGDTITAVDGTRISSAQDLLSILAQKKPGDTISVKVNSNGSTRTVQVKLGELPA